MYIRNLLTKILFMLILSNLIYANNTNYKYFPMPYTDGLAIVIPILTPTPIPTPSISIHEDAEDGNTLGWSTYSGNGTITNVSEHNGRVIALKGNAGLGDAFVLKPLHNVSGYYVSWSMKFSQEYKVYIEVKTKNGGDKILFLEYSPTNMSNVYYNANSNYHYIKNGLGKATIDNQWYTYTRDLNADLKAIFPDDSITELRAFRVRGSGYIDDIKTSEKPIVKQTDTIGLGALKIKVHQNSHGIQIASIKNHNEEVLHTIHPDIFTLDIQNTVTKEEETIGGSSGWGNVSTSIQNKKGTIVLSNPQNTKLPSTLQVLIDIDTNKTNSTWDIAVRGLGNTHSLMNVKYPTFNIKSQQNDHFFVPYYHGKVFDNPLISMTEGYKTKYPRGWGGTMQYMAYYNDNYGIYFGFHDPKASLKEFSAMPTNGGIEVYQRTMIPNKTRPNNNWKMSGSVAFNLYTGDWYEASMIYKGWVTAHADYRPIHSEAREARKNIIAPMPLWVTEQAGMGVNDTNVQYTVEQLQNHVHDFIHNIDLPTIVHWNAFNGKQFDTLYPEIFPARENLPEAITWLKNNTTHKILFSGYMNGMLYDERLDSFKEEGEPFAVKNIHQDIIHYGSDAPWLVYMCPTQAPWQTKMKDSIHRMTSEVGFDIVYIDMVTASSAHECYDTHHNHPLGGGSYWREGYKKMFEEMHHAALPKNVPFISEAANDFIIDEVDAFLTHKFNTHNQVPALSAVYSEYVQLVGNNVGSSMYGNKPKIDSDKFYTILAQSYVFGVQQGRYYMSIANQRGSSQTAEKAAVFVKKLADMRMRLEDYFSFGHMLKPLKVSGNIPTVSFKPNSYPNIYQNDVVEPVIQTSTWTDGESVMLTFVNGATPDSHNNVTFSFHFDASKYFNTTDTLVVREIRIHDNEIDDTRLLEEVPSSMTLEPADIKSYIISVQ